jgi:hydrogenase nickel incorporation protein HypA/HybF
MHERSLVRGLLNQIGDVMREHDAERVLSVRLRVGEFSGVDAELLRLAFDEMTNESPMHEAELILEPSPLAARCLDCSREFAVERFRFRCTTCGSGRISIQSGDELFLDSVTLEQAV